MRTATLALALIAALAMGFGWTAPAAAQSEGVPEAGSNATGDVAHEADLGAGADWGQPTDAVSAEAVVPATASAVPTTGDRVVSDLGHEGPETFSEWMETASTAWLPASLADDPTPTEAAQGTGMPANGTEGSTADGTEVSPAVRLGQMGWDTEGRPGRVHVVVDGDTLWDISDAYLGTPWVWPSIWTDNKDIENPHLILPGDHIWITPNEMRRITPEEAEAFLAGEPKPALEDVPAAFDDLEDAVDEPVRTYRYSEAASAGFVTVDEFNGSATIVDSTTMKVWLSQPDRVLIGWGQGETQVGDQYEIFRPGEKIVDGDTYQTLGYATEVLGWLEVEEVHEETSTAMIRLSSSEIRRGDHLIPRVATPTDIPIASSPSVDGVIVHMPKRRTESGSTDVVYLDRGTSDGLQLGSPLEVYRPMKDGFDELRGLERKLPDDVVAKMIVVAARPDTAVAVLTHASTEISIGDRFRGSDSLR